MEVIKYVKEKQSDSSLKTWTNVYKIMAEDHYQVLIVSLTIDPNHPYMHSSQTDIDKNYKSVINYYSSDKFEEISKEEWDNYVDEFAKILK